MPSCTLLLKSFSVALNSSAICTFNVSEACKLEQRLKRPSTRTEIMLSVLFFTPR